MVLGMDSLVEHVLGGPDGVRDVDADGGGRSRLLFAVLAELILVLATVPLLAHTPEATANLRMAALAGVLLTDPFAWSMVVRDRSKPLAYMGLVALNLLSLTAFFVSCDACSPPEILYLLVVLAGLDFAAGLPLLLRTVPLVLIVSIQGALPPISLWTAAALLLVVVMRELWVQLRKGHHHRTLVELRSEMESAKDRGCRDELTGLYNRHVIPDTIEELFSRSIEEGHSFGLIMLDIDHLKEANDTRGHQFGDEVIARVASLLQATKRPGDFAIRYGGDELMLVTTEVGNYDALATIAERVRVRVGGEDMDGFRPTLSIGCVLVPETEAGDFADALRKADRALYAAKRRGRDRVVRADDEEVFAS